MPDLDIAQLRSLLGLTEEQARVFATAFAHGSLTGPGVASLLGKPRSHAYALLRGLVEEGLLTEHPGRPRTYHPRPIWDALADRQGQLETLVAQLRQASSTVERDHSAPKLGEALEPSSVALFSGVPGIERETSRLLAEASASIVVTGYPMRAQKADLGILAGVRDALLRGVDVRLYMTSVEAENPIAKDLVEAVGMGRVVPYHEAELPNMGSVTTDHAVLFVFATSQPAPGTSDKVVGVRIRGSPLPEFMRRAIRQLLHPMLASPLQPSQTDGYSAYLQALSAAEVEVKMMVGSGWSQMRTPEQARELREVYKKAKARGVHSRLLLNNDAVELVFMHDSNFTEIMDEIRVGRWMPALASIIDERQVFLAVGDADTGTFVHASVDPTETKFYLQVFERLWNDAKPLPPRNGGGGGGGVWPGLTRLVNGSRTGVVTVQG